ncbi:MAG: family 20 glycosylhydrolase [Chitinophagales bacterium]|nr:family 20 glycosylhydrolase [Bacteroidota bacterium]
MKKWFGLLLICCCLNSFSQNVIIPAPVSVQSAPGYFVFDPTTYLLGTDFRSYMDGFVIKDYLIKYYNLPLKTATKKIGDGKIITLKYDSTIAVGNGGYFINITKENITITGKNEGGVLYGLLTMMQMIEKSGNNTFQIPCGTVEDYPRFEYRGMHLDCARHFFDVDFIKKYIDYLALYKMNSFHWHLTDDQGWRIEIKQYPKLTEIGAWRSGSMVGHYRDQQYDTIRYGGFYTQKQIKEIVKYANERHITVIPEIEMPGHCLAALAAYPELGCVADTTYTVAKGWGVFDEAFCPKEETFVFLQNVLDEVMALFPSQYIHIGGDEVEKIRWKNCSHCQQLIKDNNLVDEHGLQNYFIHRIDNYVTSKGRKIIGWDEILEGGITPNATIMSWRGEDGAIAAAQQNHYAIMTPGSYCYFDYYQGAPLLEPLAIGGFVTLEKVYQFNPIPAALTADQGKYILGAQGNLWTEYINYPENVEYMLLPRLLALSEVVWSPLEKRNFDDFSRRLVFHFGLLDKTGTNYAKSVYQVNYRITQTEPGADLLLELIGNKQFGDIHVTTISGINGAKNAFVYTQPFKLETNIAFVSANMVAGVKNPPVTNIKIQQNTATGKKIIIKNEPSKKYSGDGPVTLVNGIEATVTPNWSGNEWLGFSGTDLEVIIDLGAIDTINSVTVGFLYDKMSWIYPPQSMEIYVSDNQRNFQKAGQTKINSTQKRVAVKINSSITTGRYIKIIAPNYGLIPSGNPGSGSKAWLFTDEISIQ